jgi:thiol-disulfide isomerase/thioredoxin
MAKPRPGWLAAGLSAAAVLGYVSYRSLVGVAPAPGEPTAFAPEPGAETPQAEPAEGARELAERLPEFTLEGLDGAPRSITSWPGKPLLINFWATWCAPCLREIPMLKEFQAARPEELQIVGIAVDRREPVLTFAERMQFNYPILIGQSGAWEAAAAFGVEFYALPFTVFTAADGSVLGVHTGELHPEHLENLAAVLTDLRDRKIALPEARARLAGRM